MSNDVGRTYPVNPLDPRHHLTFEGALELLAAGRVDGVGLALARHLPGVRGSALCAVDLDGVLHDGELTPDARELVARLDSYSEISRSETGIHVIASGAEILPTRGRRGSDCELITDGFVAMTGMRLPGTRPDIAWRGDELLTLHARVTRPTQPSATTAVPSITVSDADVIARLRRARNAAKFSRLYDHGHLDEYDGDPSRGDLALLRLVAHYTRCPDQLRRIWASSALACGRAARWSRPAGRNHDYASRTIAKALALAGHTAHP